MDPIGAKYLVWLDAVPEASRGSCSVDLILSYPLTSFVSWLFDTGTLT